MKKSTNKQLRLTTVFLGTKEDMHNEVASVEEAVRTYHAMSNLMSHIDNIDICPVIVSTFLEVLSEDGEWEDWYDEETGESFEDVYHETYNN